VLATTSAQQAIVLLTIRDKETKGKINDILA